MITRTQEYKQTTTNKIVPGTWMIIVSLMMIIVVANNINLIIMIMITGVIILEALNI